MYILISFDIKFKTNRQKIEESIKHYGLRKIQTTLYVGELDNFEVDELKEDLQKIIRDNDSVLIIPVCRSCYIKKESFGRELKFKEQLYKVY